MRLQRTSRKKHETERLSMEFRELSLAITNSQCGTYNRDFLLAYDIGQRYLGDDAIVREKSQVLEFFTDRDIKVLEGDDPEEFNSLDDHFMQVLDGLDDHFAQHGNYGEYGIVFHGKKPELTLALEVMRTLTARQILKNGDLVSPELKNDVTKRVNIYPYVSVQFNENMMDRILMTYPDGKITRGKIKQALTPVSQP